MDSLCQRFSAGASRVLVALLAASLMTACDRAPSTSGAGGTAATADPAASGADFKLPTPDVSKWPSPVRSTFEDWRAQFRTMPKNADLLVNLGAILYVHGDAADALACFRRATELRPELRPENEAGHYFVGLALEKSGENEKAIKEYELAIACNELSAPSWSRIGNLLIEKDPERARHALEEALKTLPNDARAHFSLAKLSRKAGKNDEALEQLRTATDLYPAYVDAHKEAADVCRALGLMQEAESHAKAAAAGGRPPPTIDPLYGRLLDCGLDLPLMIQMAMMSIEQRDFDYAEERLLKALEMDTGESARVALATLRSRQGKLDEAAIMARALVEANPNSGPGNSLLGEILLTQRKNAEALACLRKAIAADANDARAHYFAGLTMRRMGDAPGAKAEFESVVRILPTFADAYQVLAEYGMKARDYAETERILRTGLARSPQAARLANILAWQLATCPDAARRNGDEAVKWALLACNLTKGSSHEFLDTLAAAFAEAGKFDEAKRASEDAIKIAKAAPANSQAEKDALAKLIEEYEAHLKSYEDRQAFHESP